MAQTDQTTYVRPFGLLAGAPAQLLCGQGQAMALAGGPLAATHAELISRRKSTPPRRTVDRVGDLLSRVADPAGPPTAMLADVLARLSAPRAPFAGIPVSGFDSGPAIMGIVNVTPDSFSDGGDHADAAAAIAHGRALREAGADIIDVGGESTRPGAEPVSVDAELARVMPVVEALAGDGVAVSIDTRHAAVMRAAIAAGACIVNDVTALCGDPAALETVAAGDASVILMHMQGQPQTMQQAPRYGDVVLEVYDALAARAAACAAAGIARARICVDPGIGFGKTAEQNMELLSSLAIFHGLGCVVGIGVSRKSFIDAIAGPSLPKGRLAGSLAAMLGALGQGAQIVRVHDVGETVQAVAVWRRARDAGERPDGWA